MWSREPQCPWGDAGVIGVFLCAPISRASCTPCSRCSTPWCCPAHVQNGMGNGFTHLTGALCSFLHSSWASWIFEISAPYSPLPFPSPCPGCWAVTAAGPRHHIGTKVAPLSPRCLPCCVLRGLGTFPGII